MNNLSVCSVCGGDKFSYKKVLWEELVKDWQLSPYEIDYINRQQGLQCESCKNSLRTIALANAILRTYSFNGTLLEFVSSNLARNIKILEINEAGFLSSILHEMPSHRLISFPEYDMTNLNIASGSFDLVIHSDTLEHVNNPLSGLSECKRILRNDGRCIFTVPVILGRLSRNRLGLKNSFHGSPKNNEDDLLVYTEYGADVWQDVLEAGFSSVKFHCIEYPSGLAIEAHI